MELLCCEGEQLKRAILDPVFYKDKRVLKNLLKLEEHYTVSFKYMDFQTDIKPYMRKVVAQWMLEVCEEQRCEDEVFPLAVNFMDRFLATYADLKRNRLQLLATACMFLASKLKETFPLSAEKLVIYTDNSITLQDLLDWELLILCKLKWDLSAVTPHDFIEILLQELGLQREILTQIRKQTLVILCMCTLELEFVMCPPSLLALACICAALSSTYTTKPKLSQYKKVFQNTTRVEMDMLNSWHEHVERLVRGRPHLDLHAMSSSKDEPVSHPGTPTDTLSVEVN